MARSRERRAWSRTWSLDRLRWVAVVLPVTFILLIEALRHQFVEVDPSQTTGHLALAGLMLAGVVVFAVLIFLAIEAAQAQLVRQNRELAAVNAVSTAIQGELGLEVVIDAALESVMASTGATDGVVRVFGADARGEGDEGYERRRSASPHGSPMPEAGNAVPHLIDVPLSTGTTVVGRLQLHLPEGADEPDLLATATLNNIGHQLASAIQISQLVAGLQRRQDEDHRLYDILLRVSSQADLTETLSAVVRDARALLRADEAGMCLTEVATQAVQFDRPQARPGGPVTPWTCIHHGTGEVVAPHGPPATCELRASLEDGPVIEASMRGRDGIAFGQIWLGRRVGPPFTDREARLLTALADLSSIAIGSARGREGERQAAIIAERERIAREMHDSLAQVLGVTHLRLRALGARREIAAVPAVADDIAELAALSEEAYGDVREAILGLREASRPGRELIDSIAAYLEKFSHQTSIASHIENELTGAPDLPPRVEIQLIRVIQEALTNVRKHGAASKVTVRLCEHDGDVEIIIEDDGRGFDLGGTLLGRDGFGLHTMRERMGLVGGSLAIDSTPGRGTRIRAIAPRGRAGVGTPT